MDLFVASAITVLVIFCFYYFIVKDLIEIERLEREYKDFKDEHKDEDY